MIAPRWSVVIPTYRDFSFLDATLSSVAAAFHELGNGPQILVVDDGSTETPESIVRRYESVGADLVVNDEQQGPIGNFNRCLELATGEYVHLLHSDDVVYRGFYRRATEAFADAHVGGYTSRCALIDDKGDRIGVSRSVVSTSGLWITAARELAWRNPLRFPGVALRRTVVEAVGDFSPELPHTADWEYWARVAGTSSWWADTAIGAGYRIHDESDTSRLMQTGRNIAERRDCVAAIEQKLAPGLPWWTTRAAHAYSSALAVRGAWMMARSENRRAAGAQLREALRSARAAGRG